MKSSEKFVLKKRKCPKNKIICIRVSEDLIKNLDNLGEKRGLNRTELISQMITYCLNQLKKGQIKCN